MNEKKINFLKYLFLFLIFLSYLYGFFVRENLAGGAEKDFINFTWPTILAFKNNFFYTLNNYGVLGEGSPPLFHILNAYLNPFTYSQITFQASITFLSFINVILFGQIIKEKFKINNLDALLYSSIFLILPFFRSSAYWGLSENLGWLFLILSIKYYVKYEKQHAEKKILTILLMCLFSSLALYTRPYLIFFPIFLILQSITKKDFSFFKYSSFFYCLFSIPGFILLFMWGGIYKIGATTTDQISLLDYHNPKFIFNNLIIFVSIIFFYFIPFEVAKINQNIKILNKKKILAFVIILSLLITLNYFDTFAYLKEINLGGGVFLKLNQILFDNKLIFFIVISSLAAALIFEYIQISKNNIILFFCLIIFCLPKFILQEYFEPLILILLFSLIDLRKNDLELIKKNKTIVIFLVYFILYFFSTYYFRYIYYNISN